jgi:hypothetical protein
MAEDESSRREAARQAVLKGTKIVTANSVIDCVVLDVSRLGARVRLSAMMVLPNQVTLCFRGGAAFKAERRWARAQEVGLAFIGPAALTERTAAEAVELAQALARLSLLPVLTTLRERRHFDDPALVALADAAQAAHARLHQALAAYGAAPRALDLFAE